MDSKAPKPSHETSIWASQLPLETETCFFILANAMDVFMTYLLLNHGSEFQDHGPEFQESNLLANYILSRYGFRGMIYFKFALVAFVTVVAQIIARTRPRTARAVLNAGTVIVSLVVVYSINLWIQHSGYFG